MRQFSRVLFVAALLASPLAAQDIGSQITDQLRQQGYDSIHLSKTWLGRLRIEARGEDQRREIIVNPRTGEILRDFLYQPDGAQVQGVQILDRSGPSAPVAGDGVLMQPAPSRPEVGRSSDRGPDTGGRGPSGPAGAPSGGGGPSR